VARWIGLRPREGRRGLRRSRERRRRRSRTTDRQGAGRRDEELGTGAHDERLRRAAPSGTEFAGADPSRPRTRPRWADERAMACGERARLDPTTPDDPGRRAPRRLTLCARGAGSVAPARVIAGSGRGRRDDGVSQA
jgi:hypothetical protein